MPGPIQAVKDKLVETYRDCPWFRGAGVSPGKDGGLVLRLNVAPGFAGQLPDHFDGFLLEVVVIDGYQKQGA